MQTKFVTLLYLKINVAANDLPDVTTSGVCAVLFFVIYNVIRVSKEVIVPGFRMSQLLYYLVGFSDIEICVVCLFIFQ